MPPHCAISEGHPRELFAMSPDDSFPTSTASPKNRTPCRAAQLLLDLAVRAASRQDRTRAASDLLSGSTLRSEVSEDQPPRRHRFRSVYADPSTPHG